MLNQILLIKLSREYPTVDDLKRLTYCIESSWVDFTLEGLKEMTKLLEDIKKKEVSLATEIFEHYMNRKDILYAWRRTIEDLCVLGMETKRAYSLATEVSNAYKEKLISDNKRGMNED